ncbi:MAG: hypothetical protein KW802_01830 [Candidatus Doudnabacteria bacterium]|nr:hypothetical protein [Candidatus Doudnabacteria bacterium]
MPSPASPTTSPLLTRVQALPDYRSAQRAAFGTNGAARIAIRGDINWNFYAGDQLLGLGSVVSAPTDDVSKLPVLNDLVVSVRSF